MRIIKKYNEQGFVSWEVLCIAVAVFAVIGVGAWRVMSMNKTAHEQSNISANKTVSGGLVSEDREKLAGTLKSVVTDNHVVPPAPNTTSAPAASTSTTPAPTSRSTATSPPAAPSSTTVTNDPKTATPNTSSTAPSPALGTSTTAAYRRPTPEFCASKNGASFDAWTTDNAAYTYQMWQNGALKSVTETGTAALGSDSMKIIGVIPYKTKAAWAHCSEKAGYVMFYYHPSGSVYIYNWLVPFDNLSLVYF